MDTLEQHLTELGSHLVFPATPPLAAAVRVRLSAEWSRRRTPRWRLIAAALAAALAIVFGIPPVRTAVAHWLGISGIVIRPVPSLPAATPPRASPSVSDLGRRLGLGTVSSLRDAQALAGFVIAVPGSLGAPDAVYVRTEPGRVVTLVYRPRPGLPQSAQTGVGILITEFRGSVDPGLFQKLIVAGTPLTPVTVNGGQGYWIPSVHGIAYELADGSIYPDQVRLAGPVLIFERGDMTVRIEGAGTEDRALAIAASLG